MSIHYKSLRQQTASADNLAVTPTIDIRTLTKVKYKRVQADGNCALVPFCRLASGLRFLLLLEGECYLHGPAKRGPCPGAHPSCLRLHSRERCLDDLVESCWVDTYIIEIDDLDHV